MIYQVVVNQEGQYSIWQSGRALPLGWESIEVEGTREECLAHIGQIWKDMKPRSLDEQDESDKHGSHNES